MSISGSNTKYKDDERIKKEEYHKREEVMQLSTICARNKVSFLANSYALVLAHGLIYIVNYCVFYKHDLINPKKNPDNVPDRCAIWIFSKDDCCHGSQKLKGDMGST